jgi:hypothetical protein
VSQNPWWLNAQDKWTAQGFSCQVRLDIGQSSKHPHTSWESSLTAQSKGPPSPHASNAAAAVLLVPASVPALPPNEVVLTINNNTITKVYSRTRVGRKKARSTPPLKEVFGDPVPEYQLQGDDQKTQTTLLKRKPNQLLRLILGEAKDLLSLMDTSPLLLWYPQANLQARSYLHQHHQLVSAPGFQLLIPIF